MFLKILLVLALFLSPFARTWDVFAMGDDCALSAARFDEIPLGVSQQGQVFSKRVRFKYFPDSTTLDVNQTSKVTEGSLHSGGLGPCIAVFIYHRESHTVWAAHASSSDVILDFIESALSEKGLNQFDPQSLEVYLTGGAPVSSLDHRYAKRRREALEFLVNHGFQLSRIKVRWLPGSDLVAQFSINVTTGVIGLTFKKLKY